MRQSILTSIVLLALAGCVAPPANNINIQTPMGKYIISNPKNTIVKDFQATVDEKGVLQIKFGMLQSTNDWQVIDKTAAGQAFIIKTIDDLISHTTDSIAKGAK